jgi:hypothetical protein
VPTVALIALSQQYLSVKQVPIMLASFLAVAVLFRLLSCLAVKMLVEQFEMDSHSRSKLLRPLNGSGDLSTPRSYDKEATVI